MYYVAFSGEGASLPEIMLFHEYLYNLASYIESHQIFCLICWAFLFYHIIWFGLFCFALCVVIIHGRRHNTGAMFCFELFSSSLVSVLLRAEVVGQRIFLRVELKEMNMLILRHSQAGSNNPLYVHIFPLSQISPFSTINATHRWLLKLLCHS